MRQTFQCHFKMAIVEFREHPFRDEQCKQNADTIGRQHECVYRRPVAIFVPTGEEHAKHKAGSHCCTCVRLLRSAVSWQMRIRERKRNKYLYNETVYKCQSVDEIRFVKHNDVTEMRDLSIWTHHIKNDERNDGTNASVCPRVNSTLSVNKCVFFTIHL